MNMLTREFWLAAVERAVNTAAQVLLGFLTVDVAITTIDWMTALSVTATATVVSVLKSVAVAKLTDGSPSLATESVEYQPRHRAE